jgi:hypothetical protein
LTLWREANEQESNRCNDQEDLADDREECDDGITADQQKIQSSR